jgi:ferredoxin
MEKWVEMNAEYAKVWPAITWPKTPLPEAEKWATVTNKYPEHFSPKKA